MSQRWIVECDGEESNICEAEGERWCRCGLDAGHRTKPAAMACLIRYLQHRQSCMRSVIAQWKAERAVELARKVTT